MHGGGAGRGRRGTPAVAAPCKGRRRGRAMVEPNPELPMKVSPLAGKPAPPSMLVDVPRLVTAYYDEPPDPDRAAPARRLRHLRPSRLAAGRSLQRGPHPRHQPGDLPLPRGAGDRRARSSSAWTRTRSPSRRLRTALEVLAANGVEVMIDAGRRLHADAGHLARDPHATTAAGAPALADGIVDHAVAQPARGRRLQVQPAARRPRRHRRHASGSRTRANELLARRPATASSACRSHARSRRRPRTAHDYIAPYVADLPTRHRPGRDRAAPGSSIGVDPLGGAERRLLGRDRRALRARPRRSSTTPSTRPSAS